MRISFVAIPLFLALAASAAEVSFDVQPRHVEFGEPATAFLVFSGTASAPDVALPDMPGIRVGATGQQMQYNSATGAQVTRTYQLHFANPGTNVIGPFSFQMDGKTVDLPAVTVVVHPASSTAAAGNTPDALQLVLAPPSPAYPQYPVALDLTLYSQPSLQLAGEINLVGGIPDALVPVQFDRIQAPYRTERDGRVLTAQRFRLLLVASAPGTWECAPVLRVGIVEPDNRRSRDPFFDGFGFDGFFGRSATVTPRTLAAAPATVEVRPVPAEGRPPAWTGAIGDFRFTATAAPAELAVGEPVTVTLALSGTGNIATVPIPSYADTDGYKTYPPRQIGDAPAPNALSGERRLEQVVLPKTDALTELPALEFPYFDVSTGTYRTLTAGPFPLSVRPAPNGANAMLLQIPGAEAAAPGALVRGEDIVYLKPAPARFRAAVPRPGLPFLLGFYLPPPVLLAALALALRRHRRLRGNVAAARRQKAPRAARAGLKAARAARARDPTPEAVVVPLDRAATDYFAHRLNLPPGAADPALILQRLEAAGAPAPDLDRWREFFDLAAQIRYAPSAVPLDSSRLAAWCDTLSTLLRAADRLPLR